MKRHRSFALLSILQLVLISGFLVACSDPLSSQSYNNYSKDSGLNNPNILEIPVADRGAPISFSGVSDANETITQDDYKNKILVINFWYAACGPCRSEARDLEKVYLSFSDQPLSFLGINTQDSVASAREFADTYGVTYPSLLAAKDPLLKSTFANFTPINLTPTTLVLDYNSRLAARIIGRIPSRSTLATLIRTVLDEQKP